MRVAIHQPNYLPWCGYFAKMQACDVFIFLDDVQMPGGQSFVYRTNIRGPQGKQWLSVPTHFAAGDPILKVRFANPKWARKHINSLRGTYARSQFFKPVFSLLESLYLDPGETLAEFNMRSIRAVADYLRLRCRIEVSSSLKPQGDSDERLISLTRLVGGDTYLSGKGGQNYQNPAKFKASGVELEVRVYDPVAYPQIQGDFIPGLSVVDALFHLGPDAVGVLRYSDSALLYNKKDM